MKLSIHLSYSLPSSSPPSPSHLIPFKSFLSHCSAPWSQLQSVKTHTAAAETYYGGLCMPPVAKTQEESPMTAAATISTTPGYSQYTSAETNYSSPSHNHQHPLHFGEPITRASKTSPERSARTEKLTFPGLPAFSSSTGSAFSGYGAGPTYPYATKRYQEAPPSSGTPSGSATTPVMDSLAAYYNAVHNVGLPSQDYHGADVVAAAAVAASATHPQDQEVS